MSLIDNYEKPTPNKWRKVGDSIALLGTTITGYAIIQHEGWAIVSLILTWAGKTITEFATDDR